MESDLFLDNKYTKWYYKLINNVQQRASFKGYGEEHHIIPKSLGGSNKPINLVKLTAKEHFIVHHLLTKMVTGKDSSKMWFAFYCMAYQTVTNQKRDYIITARIYNIIRLEVAKAASQRSHKTKLKIIKWIEEHVYNFLNLDGSCTSIHYRPTTHSKDKKQADKNIKDESSMASCIVSYRNKNSTGIHDEFLDFIKDIPTLDVLKYKERAAHYLAFIRENKRLPMKGSSLSNWYGWVTDKDRILVDTIVKNEGMLVISNKVVDITGLRFGKLVVLEYVGQDKTASNRSAFWKCKCDCGTISTLQQVQLRISCGCTYPAWSGGVWSEGL